jgi:DNA polymerase (family 10)
MNHHDDAKRYYFNTTDIKGEPLHEANLKSRIQNEEILKIYLAYGDKLTPCECWDKLGGDKFAPLTSIRRGITTLTKQGRLLKLKEKKPKGVYGKPAYYWIHPKNQTKAKPGYMKLNEALEIAQELAKQLAPHCYRIEVAGSIRRKRPEVKDIELVCIPKPYDVGLFQTGIASVVNQWEKVKGELPCKYTQRQLHGGIKLDLFMATPENWGLILAIRTGSAEYSHKVLGAAWKARGYKSVNGMLAYNGKEIAVRSEEELYTRIGLTWIAPEKREYKPK